MTEPRSEELKRDRSTVEFPYLDLDNSVELAKAVHQAGSRCTREQLAARVNQESTSGGFYARITTAKMFGLFEYDKGTVSLTKLGLQICDPNQEKGARAQAFLNVELYTKLFERFKGVTLPQGDGLANEIELLGVAKKQKDKARQVFLRSAKQAGFFEFGTDKLVLPSGAPGIEKPSVQKETKRDSSHSDSVILPRKEGINPFIEGLFESLPTPHTQWPADERKKWLVTAENIFGLIFKD